VLARHRRARPLPRVATCHGEQRSLRSRRHAPHFDYLPQPHPSGCSAASRAAAKPRARTRGEVGAPQTPEGRRGATGATASLRRTARGQLRRGRDSNPRQDSSCVRLASGRGCPAPSSARGRSGRSALPASPKRRARPPFATGRKPLATRWPARDVEGGRRAPPRHRQLVTLESEPSRHARLQRRQRAGLRERRTLRTAAVPVGAPRRGRGT